MRWWVVFLKTWREMTRDWWALGLTLVFSPLFVFGYWAFTQGGSTSYTVLVINQDQGAALVGGGILQAGKQAIQAVQAVKYADGTPLLKVARLDDLDQVDRILKDRGAVAFLVIPPDFSRTILALQAGDRSQSAHITFGGDLTNPYYTLGATLAIGAVDSYVIQATGQKPLVNYVEKALAGSAARTEFEIYTPGVMIFSVMMLIFLAAMLVAREVESGTLRRLQITRMSSFDFLGGVTLAMLSLAVLSLLITILAAVWLGFRSQGPLWAAVVVGAVASLSIIGAGLVVACFSSTVSQAFIIANFPLGLFMFFSGAIFPLPRLVLFQLAGHDVGLFDFLPPAHAVVALNKVLTLGAGLQDVSYELTALVLLSLLYFGVGVWLFQRLHMGGRA
jgi:ABC-2 type transport system permease protein